MKKNFKNKKIKITTKLIKKRNRFKAGAWVDRCLFESPYYLCLCLNEKQFIAEMNRLDIPIKSQPNYPKTGANVNYFEGTKYGKLIAIVSIASCKGKLLECIFALIVHECMHIWRTIIKSMDEKKPSSEFEAYAMANLTQGFFGAYLEMTGKKKHKRGTHVV
jgi:hypothetical protein